MRTPRPGDDGFTLVEVVVSLMLTVTVMLTTAGFFVRAVAATRLMQQRQGAVAVAQQAMERVRAEPVSALVQELDENLGLPVSLSINGINDPAYRVGNTNYEVRTTIVYCGVPLVGGVCTADAVLPHLLMLQVTVNVRWRTGPHAGCSDAGGLCEFTVTTLLDSLPTSTSQLTEVRS